MIDKESAVIFGNIFQSTYCALFISRVVRILMHDRINHGMKQSAVIFSCISDNVSSTVKSVIYFVQQVARYDLWFPCSVHLDARQNQPQHEIKCGDFLVHFRQRNHPPSRALFISCIKLHATHWPDLSVASNVMMDIYGRTVDIILFFVRIRRLYQQKCGKKWMYFVPHFIALHKKTAAYD